MNKKELNHPSKSRSLSNKKRSFSKLNAFDLIVPADIYDLEPITLSIPCGISGCFSQYTIVA